MDQTQTLFDTHLPPLAERLRPTSIDDYKGQSHLVGNGKILRTIIEEEKINEITENIVKQLPTLIGKKIDLFSSKVNQDLNGI